MLLQSRPPCWFRVETPIEAGGGGGAAAAAAAAAVAAASAGRFVEPRRAVSPSFRCGSNRRFVVAVVCCFLFVGIFILSLSLSSCPSVSLRFFVEFFLSFFVVVLVVVFNDDAVRGGAGQCGQESASEETDELTLISPL